MTKEKVITELICLLIFMTIYFVVRSLTKTIADTAWIFCITFISGNICNHIIEKIKK